MDEITLQNYRCFREEQKARLARLTLLVGENSTGKSSLLAMIRCIWNVIYRGARVPDFSEPPFDLGGFADIVHARGGRVPRPDRFCCKMTDSQETDDGKDFECRVEFTERNDYPAVASVEYRQNGYGIRLGWDDDSDPVVILPNREFSLSLPEERRGFPAQFVLVGMFSQLMRVLIDKDVAEDTGNKVFTESERERLQSTISSFRFLSPRPNSPRVLAPLRAEPQRNYSIGPSEHDPGGGSLPSRLMSLEKQDPKQWESIRTGLESFGQELGLFNEFRIAHFRRGKGIGPFQLQVRGNPATGTTKGPWRNLTDVGYGVSQILPAFVELLSSEDRLVLMQQPEIHLHPRAQAAMGTLLCNWIADNPDGQLIVETHSEYLLDRIRMEVRDDSVDIAAKDVSIVFFESRGLDVEIHNVKFDERGNVDAPPSYAAFFMDEVSRSIR